MSSVLSAPLPTETILKPHQMRFKGLADGYAIKRSQESSVRGDASDKAFEEVVCFLKRCISFLFILAVVDFVDFRV